MADAGSDSPHLKPSDRRKADRLAIPHAVLIHEVVREDGERELARPAAALAWSALAAGLSIGFSFLAEAYLRAGLKGAAWGETLSSVGYSLGFLIVVLGRQQLFTETTLTAVIPFLVRPDAPTFAKLMRVWAVVLACNILGTLAFGAISAQAGVFPPETRRAMDAIASQALGSPFWVTAVRAGSAGWLMALMVWLLPAAQTGRVAVIVALTSMIALGGFPHIVAGSVESAYAVATGAASPADYLLRFFAPTLLGNIVGGSALTAVLNHAPVKEDVEG